MTEITEAGQEKQESTTGTAPPPEHHPHRWLALTGLALVQFIIFLDATIVNVALPSIRRDLGFTSAGLTWVVSGYLLAAGGLLLLCGRLSDLFGRRRIFGLGAGLFAVASLTAALAQSPAMLIASRFAQGMAEALAAPAALSMVVLLFTDEKERTKALGIWGGLAGLGATSGVLLSGVLTDLASWRWIFYIAIPPCVASLIITYRLVPDSRGPAARRPSWLSAVLLTGGLIAVIKGLLAAADTSWGSVSVLGPVVGGLAVLTGFLAFQRRAAAPLIPLGFFTNRTRLAGYAAQMFMAIATAAMFFLIVLYMQETLRYSPLECGLAWLPFTVAFMPGLVASTRLLLQVGHRAVLTSGLILISAGVFLFSRLGPESSFAAGLLPAMLLTAFGSGVTAPAMQIAALDSVSQQDAGLGSGVLATVQQVSQALGLSVIVAIGLSHQRSLVAGGTPAASAVIQGHELALRIAAAVLLVGGISIFALMRKPSATAVSAAT
ncbi:conserved membrane hypothetical protein [Frankia canadensis]|uniref:Major facilitator superfamily (MFS) profile domain-containing protein n=1 Tax=Frankia canadensis TaxID=1836972 RepID=A0A2I2L275_9ACTN|nr:MFS transporter [Frankia canadensis]SNQ52030.1 conserved membrane hypothetical protein [Frankia canadensis]SOU59320.1 conserved membrane hypothetical protein [Frankia canadensis]